MSDKRTLREIFNDIACLCPWSVKERKDEVDQALQEVRELIPEPIERGYRCNECDHFEVSDRYCNKICTECGDGEMLFQIKDLCYNQSITEIRERLGL